MNISHCFAFTAGSSWTLLTWRLATESFGWGFVRAAILCSLCLLGAHFTAKSDRGAR